MNIDSFQEFWVILGCLFDFDAFCFCVKYLRLRALQRQSYTHYFYEATVGAGLPIISTLRGLLETGDKIQRIEGILRSIFHVCFFDAFIKSADQN